MKDEARTRRTLAELRQQFAILRQHLAVLPTDSDYLKTVLGNFERQLAAWETEHEESRTQARLAALYRVSRLFGSSLDTQTVLEQVMDALIQLTSAERGFVMLLNKESGEMEFQVMRNLEAEAISHTVTWQVVQKGEALLTTNALEDPRFSGQESIQVHSLRSIMAAPLRVRGESVGAVYVDNRMRTGLFDDDDLALLEAFAQQAAIAIQNARLFTRLAQTKERLAVIINNSPDAIVLLGADGDLKEVNPAFDRLFGCEGNDPNDLVPSDLTIPESLEAGCAAFAEAIEQGSAQRLEIVARRLDGATFDADVALSPVKKEDIVTDVVCSVRDISGMKEAARMKDAFISNVSHELRTPIASLKLYHDLLQRNPVKQAVYLERLVRETERLHRLVEDVLYLSRMEQNEIPLNVTPTDLNMLVQQYATDRAVLGEENSLTLVCNLSPDMPIVSADAALMGRVVGILLTNALNYTPAGGTVTVTTRMREAEGRRWVGFCVQDTGPGILPQEEPHLFERFFRGAAAKEANLPGTGLGLSIAHQIVMRHNGRIQLEPTLGSGAAFSVWVPV